MGYEPMIFLFECKDMGRHFYLASPAGRVEARVAG